MPEQRPPIDDFPFRPVFDAAKNAMLLVDDEPRLIAANGAATALLRYPDGALDGAAVADIAKGGARGLREGWQEIVAAGDGVLHLRTADGQLVEVELHVTERVGDGVHLVIVDLAASETSSPWLTPRQEDTLRLLCDGATNQQIANALGISEPTVQKHIASIKERLGAATRAQAVALALQRPEFAERVVSERLYVHQAIRVGTGPIADTRLVYVSHETRTQQPEIVPQIGQSMSSWYPDYTRSELFAMIAEAIETGEIQSTDRIVLRPPWRPSGYHLTAIAAPIGPERAVFMTASPLGR
jgi:DNA-binding CsgD family transcriptional regulator